MPNYITAPMWKGMFHRQFGAINGILVALHVQPVSWFTHWSTSFAANVATNTWLGFPFMMVMALGALQSIPQDLYEAAEVDRRVPHWAQVPAHHAPALAAGDVAVRHSRHGVDVQHVQHHLPGLRRRAGRLDGHPRVPEAYRWAFQRNEQYRDFAACVLRPHLRRLAQLLRADQARDPDRRRGGVRDEARKLVPSSTWACCTSALTLVCVVTLYPVLWVVKLALSPATESLSLSPILIPRARDLGPLSRRCTTLRHLEGRRGPLARLWPATSSRSAHRPRVPPRWWALAVLAAAAYARPASRSRARKTGMQSSCW